MVFTESEGMIGKNNSELDTAHKLRQLPRPYQS
jgi:hypothetical protein